MTSDSGPCAICGGSYGEHQRSEVHHVFTQNEGELMTPQQAAKQRGAEQAPRVVIPPAPTGALERLIEVLLGQKMLNTEEAFYIAGMGPRPSYQHSSGYRDPAV